MDKRRWRPRKAPEGRDRADSLTAVREKLRKSRFVVFISSREPRLSCTRPKVSPTNRSRRVWKLALRSSHYAGSASLRIVSQGWKNVIVRVAQGLFPQIWSFRLRHSPGTCRPSMVCPCLAGAPAIWCSTFSDLAGLLAKIASPR